MRLCFATFAKTLYFCRQRTNQEILVAKIIKCIDPCSNYLDQDYRYSDGWDIKGDKFAINKLLHCTRPFTTISNEFSKVSKREFNTLRKKFKTNVSPLINEDKQASAILTLLNIIKQDKVIDSENAENFKKYLGMDKQQLLQQEKFVFPDFIVRILLYTVYGNVDNRDGKEYIKFITKKYVDSCRDSYFNEYKWDSATQTLTLSFVEIFSAFNQAIHNYQIDKFVETVDPTNMMDIAWVEKCEGFLMHTKTKILCDFTPPIVDSHSFTIQAVQEFVQTLNDYLDFLGIKMRPLVKKPNPEKPNPEESNIFLPMYRDENVKWAMDFNEDVHNYRQKLISIYQKIYMHMPFASGALQ